MRSCRSALHHDLVCEMGIDSPFRHWGNSDGVTTFGRIQRYNLASDPGGSDKLHESAAVWLYIHFSNCDSLDQE
jgi:hypothetical protein